MELIGHRGCAAQFPENTCYAVREASRRLSAVEIDVRRCGSGELVAFHDETLERVTDATGRLAEVSLTELQRLEVFDSGEPVPRLETVLETVPSDVTLQVELKERGLAADVGSLLDRTGVDARLSSFQVDVLEEARAVDPDRPLGYLFRTDADRALSVASELDCTHLHPHYDCCLETDVVATAQGRGLEVVAWRAARTVEHVRALHGVGVDGVTADRYDILPARLEADLTPAASALSED